MIGECKLEPVLRTEYYRSGCQSHHDTLAMHEQHCSANATRHEPDPKPNHETREHREADAIVCPSHRTAFEDKSNVDYRASLDQNVMMFGENPFMSTWTRGSDVSPSHPSTAHLHHHHPSTNSSIPLTLTHICAQLERPCLRLPLRHPRAQNCIPRPRLVHCSGPCRAVPLYYAPSVTHAQYKRFIHIHARSGTHKNAHKASIWRTLRPGPRLDPGLDR